ncbi:MAG: TIGR00295 family protein [Methanomicrobia archaeon]|nr:TIGR00295 family protein [Methanomicrobia archaeon]
MEAASKEELRLACNRILRAAGCDEDVIRHCNAVADLALEFAHRHSESVDEPLIFKGALLHDLGRARSHGIDHGVVGGAMARALGLDETIVRIIERHIGAGLTAAEAEMVGLPPRDLLPETLEEKIVAHADNLIAGWKRRSIDVAIADFKTALGESHPSIKRMLALHKEVVIES